MKKATGMVRRVDDLGRLVLPKELRSVYGIATGDPVEIYVTNDEIVLRKYVEDGSCTFCGSAADDYLEMGDHRICPGCAGLIMERMGS